MPTLESGIWISWTEGGFSCGQTLSLGAAQVPIVHSIMDGCSYAAGNPSVAHRVFYSSIVTGWVNE